MSPAKLTRRVTIPSIICDVKVSAISEKWKGRRADEAREEGGN